MRLALRLPWRVSALLVLSYLRAVPGLPWLCGIGLLCWLASHFAADPTQGTAWSVAAIAFLVAAPILFAGPQFRDLAARRSHLLLPGFALQLWRSTLLLFMLAAIASAALWPDLTTPQRAAVLPLAFAAWSALFWFGFLPTLLRMLLGFALLAWLAGLAPSLASFGTDSELATYAPPVGLLAVLGWTWMLIWLQRRCASGRVFARSQHQRWNLPAALFVPNAERVGTPDGTLLLGQSDAVELRWQRAALGVLFIPLLLWAALRMAMADARLGLPDNAVLGFLALTYALALYTQLCLQAATRRPLLWLRSDTDWPGLHALAERVLWREWWPLAVCWLVYWLLAWQISSRWPWHLGQLGLVWLLALLVNLYLCLLATHRPFWLKAGLALHLLLLSLALAADRIGAAAQPLVWLASGQLLLIAVLRQWGRTVARRGTG